jgi:hypothetical protein
MLHLSIRALAFVLGLLMFLGGVATVSLGGPEGLTGAWVILVGSAFMIGAVLQRSRYRPEVTERSNVDPGPGGARRAGSSPVSCPRPSSSRTPRANA